MAMVLALLLPGTASAQLTQQHSFNVRGDVEMVGSRILNMSRGLYRIVGRVLRLN